MSSMMKRRSRKKALCMILICAMLLSTVQMPVFAAETPASAAETVAAAEGGMAEADGQPENPGKQEGEAEPEDSEKQAGGEVPEDPGKQEGETQPEAPGKQDGEAQPEAPGEQMGETQQGNSVNTESVFLSGITIDSKVYDGMPISYTGTPVLKDASGNVLSDISVEVSYAGTFADGSVYESSENAPSQAGSYTLTFSLQGEAADCYTLKDAVYSFEITRKEATVRADSAEVIIGAELPEVSELTYTVEGLLADEPLVTEPVLKYGAKTVTTDRGGEYEIIPYGADGGNNYTLIYVNGVLTVNDAEIVVGGKVNDINWTIDKNGKLRLTGTGEWIPKGVIIQPWFTERWQILSAEVSVTGMTSAAFLFMGCTNMRSVDLSGFDTSKLKNTSQMFDGCRSLTSIDMSVFSDSSIEEMPSMFSDCKSLESLDLSGFNMSATYWDGTSGFIRGCDSLTTIRTPELGPKRPVELPVVADSCWYDENNVAYDSIPAGTGKSMTLTRKKLDAGTINDISWQVDGDGKLTITGNGSYSANVDGASEKPPWINRTDVKSAEVKVTGLQSAYYMFYGCKNLAEIDFSGTDMSDCSNMQFMFAGCSSLTNVNLGNFNTEKVGSMESMFAGCSSLTSLNLGNFDTGNVRNMNSMFKDCSSLTNLNVSNFDTEKVGSMESMFKGCSSLTSLNLSHFNTGNVEGMGTMFEGCSNLENLNLSGFDTGKVGNMEAMFSGCGKLKSLDLSSFHINSSKAVSINNIFEGCGSLESLDLSGLDFSQSTAPNDASSYPDLVGCDKLSYIRTPKNCSVTMTLPGEDTWYDENGAAYTALPLNLPNSIELYRGAKPEDGTTKRRVFVSGVTMDSKTYDKESCAYTGTAVVTDAAGTPVANVELTASYSGTLTDGSVYESTTQAPDQAGTYRLSFQMAGSDAEQYILQKSEFVFRIYKKTVTITAPEYTIEIGGQTPNLQEGAACNIEGLLEGEQLTKMPSLKYGQKDISTDRPCAYDIIPYGAQGGNNYRITYVNAKLKVGVEGSYDLADAEIEFENIVYDNKSHIVNPVVRYGDWTLKFGTDYKLRVSPSSGSMGNYPTVFQLGKHTIYVTGIGFYCGEKQKTFYVVKPGTVPDTEFGDVQEGDIPEDHVIPKGLWIAGLSDGDFTYTGKAVKPQVRVYDHKTLLKEKTDYTISYKNNVNVNVNEDKVPSVTITGKGNYQGKATEYFDIWPCFLESCMPNYGSYVLDMTIAYNGKEQSPIPNNLQFNNKKLRAGKDFTVTYLKGGWSGEVVESIKEPGNYTVRCDGIGNFYGDVNYRLRVVDDGKLMSKMNVSKIANQPYTGDEIRPNVTVKDGKKTLEQGTDYEVEYEFNVEVGKANVYIVGVDGGGYYGAKTVTFNITGTPIKKATVTGLQGQTFTYQGTDHMPAVQLTVRGKTNEVEEQRQLTEGTDYTLVWQKNCNAGTATAVFTGMGAYTGTLKKTFKIKKFDIGTNADGRLAAVLEETSVPYAKGGAKPKPTVTFLDGDGNQQTLKEGTDYTLSWTGNKSITLEGRVQPTVTIKGKGNFSGTYAAKLPYRIVRQDLEELILTAQDKTYQPKKNIYATKVTITDLDGKNLQAGKDYDKAFSYTYKEETTVIDAATQEATVRAPGAAVDKNDIIPQGTVLCVKAQAKADGNYQGTIEGEYRITRASIASASVTIPKQTYTGKEITLDKSQITVKVKGKEIDPSQYEIVADSYKNNIKKGNASVTIRGLNDYGGTKTVKFGIVTRAMSWWQDEE